MGIIIPTFLYFRKYEKVIIYVHVLNDCIILSKIGINNDTTDLFISVVLFTLLSDRSSYLATLSPFPFPPFHFIILYQITVLFKIHSDLYKYLLIFALFLFFILKQQRSFFIIRDKIVLFKTLSI